MAHQETGPDERPKEGEGAEASTQESGSERPTGWRGMRRRYVLALGWGAGVTTMGVAGYLGRGQLLRWASQGGDQYTQLAWRRLTLDPEQMARLTWQKFDGDPSVSSQNPSDFKKVGLVAMNSEVADDARRALNGVQATAWRVNTTTIDVGVMHTGQSFYSSPRDDPNLYAFGQRIGGGSLEWTPGLWRPNPGEFVIPQDAEIHSLGSVAIADLPDLHPGVIYV